MKKILFFPLLLYTTFFAYGLSIHYDGCFPSPYVFTYKNPLFYKNYTMKYVNNSGYLRFDIRDKTFSLVSINDDLEQINNLLFSKRTLSNGLIEYIVYDGLVHKKISNTVLNEYLTTKLYESDFGYDDYVTTYGNAILCGKNYEDIGYALYYLKMIDRNGKEIILPKELSSVLVNSIQLSSSFSFDKFNACIFESSQIKEGKISPINNIHLISFIYEGVVLAGTDVYQEPKEVSKRIVSTDKDALVKVVSADIYEITGTYEDFWYKVENINFTGWCRGKDLIIEQMDWKGRVALRGKYLRFDEIPQVASNELNAVVLRNKTILYKHKDSYAKMILYLSAGQKLKVIEKSGMELKPSNIPYQTNAIVYNYWYKVITETGDVGWVFGTDIDMTAQTH